MTDIARWLKTVHREVAAEDTEQGRARTVMLRRSFAATTEDVWDAMTDPERLRRWFCPVTGDLRVGGKYQLEGNAGGDIRQCDKPSLLVVTWEYDGGGSTDLEVRLAPEGESATLVELRHTAVLPMDDETWAANLGHFAPGWDDAFRRLDGYLSGELAEEGAANDQSPEALKLWEFAGAEWGRVVESWRR